MKILSAEQIRNLDEYTIKNEPVLSIDLMERASEELYWSILTEINPDQKIIFICGPGNNGGDGYAIARKMIQAEFDCLIYGISNVSLSADAAINRSRLAALASDKIINLENDLIPEINAQDIVIDALFGTGLNRKVESYYAEIINYINRSGATIFSIDIPSGLFTDRNNDDEDAIINAHKTFTIQVPKLSFMLCENQKYLGDWSVLNIGLNEAFITSQNCNHFYLEKEDIKPLIKHRDKIAHKGNFGHALIWAGAYGKVGAAVMSASACMRIGAGLSTAYIPGCAYEIMQTVLPEIMVLSDNNKKYLSNAPDTSIYNSIGAGPGIGNQLSTRDALINLLKHFRKPMVLDADALNLLAAHPDMMELITPNSILTPHPKEFERLSGKAMNDFDRLEKASTFAQDYSCILVLKSAITSIHTPEGEVFFNSSGNPGMAKGGSGDVLCGILTGLLAQGYQPLSAAKIGVFIHGLAADLALEKSSIYSLSPMDIISAIGKAYNYIQENESW